MTKELKHIFIAIAAIVVLLLGVWGAMEAWPTPQDRLERWHAMNLEQTTLPEDMPSDEYEAWWQSHFEATDRLMEDGIIEEILIPTSLPYRAEGDERSRREQVISDLQELIVEMGGRVDAALGFDTSDESIFVSLTGSPDAIAEAQRRLATWDLIRHVNVVAEAAGRGERETLPGSIFMVCRRMGQPSDHAPAYVIYSLPTWAGFAYWSSGESPPFKTLDAAMEHMEANGWLDERVGAVITDPMLARAALDPAWGAIPILGPAGHFAQPDALAPLTDDELARLREYIERVDPSAP